MRFAFKLWVLMFLVTFVSACSNGGSDDDKVQQGRFVDSPVSGLDYISSVGQGQTDSMGRFSYRPADILDFYLGGVTGVHMGSARGAAFITPLDFLASGANNRIAINMARFLMGLDTDGDNSNGIQLSDEVIDAAKGLNLSFSSFDVEPSNFPPASLLAYVQSHIDSLPGAEIADEHLRCTLEDIAQGREPDGLCSSTDESSEKGANEAGSNETGGNGDNGSANTDSDNDGVNDPLDKCPDTPAGESIDSQGCSDAQKATDSDGDGVNDSQDQCPDTPQGESVNPNGCSSTQQGADADSDGVKDPLDKCPATPNGESVDGNGCAQSQLDDDNDGVSNAADQCAGTPDGETVDANGCAQSQLDDDGDGVFNTVDQCPATPSGESVDGNGCAPSQKDTDGDGVNDDKDNCPATPMGEAVNSEGCPILVEDEKGPIRTLVDETLCDPLLGSGACLSDVPGVEEVATTLDNLLFDGGVTEPGENYDADLISAAADSALRGCDFLDTSHCMYPFPNDHFTVAAPDNSPQSVDGGGTGRRVNFNVLGMPRNIAGKPIDPTEWNRNDGFSPGQLITTFVPDLDLDETGGVSLTDLAAYLDQDAPILVVNATTSIPHMVWAEMDANAGLLARAGDVGGPESIDNPQPAQSALLIRPAVNFEEGQRYIVILRNLKDSEGNVLDAAPGMQACRAGNSQLPPVAERCAYLASNVFPVVDSLLSESDELYLAWDFTVASTNNNIARLRHMRDDAFAALSPDPATVDCTQFVEGAGCRTPEFTVDKVTENPKAGISKRIEGTLKVPSYMVPMDASPAEDPQFQAVLNEIESRFPEEFEALFEGAAIAQGGSVPPNRLFFDPTDGPNPNDPQGSLYGNGLPDRMGGVAEMTTRYVCQIPEQATPENPARPGVYGHGLLDGRMAITYDKVPEFSREHNFLFCAVDLFGFSTGDLPNVASALVDFSNFPVIPDASQQGVLNFTYLARLLADPAGFASHPEFQSAGTALFSPGEVFYDGNSQGGITGGVIVAASKDIKRGVLGVPGMNYSTLLRRSVDFDLYSVPVYVAYPNDLDRNFLFSIMQMLWDRSENNGYAHHITDNSKMSGPDNQVLLHPGFGDHQVTMWSADVMARTIGASYDFDYKAVGSGATYAFVDDSDFLANRHPDTEPWFGLPRLDFANTQMTKGSAIITWDEGKTAAPPVGNTAPRADDHDPHGYPRALKSARCQKSHFLHYDGKLINVDGVTSELDCPVLDSTGGGDGDGDGDGDADDFALSRSDFPDLGDVCTAYGLPQGEVCDQMEDVHQQAFDQCMSNGGNTELCTVTGGNLFALMSECHANGGAQAYPVCNAIEVLITGAASYCRTFSQVSSELIMPEVCSLIGGVHVTDRAVAEFTQSWTGQALALQYELNRDLPMSQWFFPSTHNSFNHTGAHTPPTLSGSDSNQFYSIVDQLRMGIRGIEIDVHWMPSIMEGGFRPTVCHGNQQHFGCTYERSLRTELAELNAWLEANPDQVVVLDLEANMGEPLDGPTDVDGQRYSMAREAMLATVGDRLYTPAENGSTCSDGQPVDATISDIRATGSQLIIYTGGCDEAWGDVVFSRNGTHTQSGSGSWAGMSYPDDCRFSENDIDNKWTRMYEDATLVGGAAAGASTSTPQDVLGMTRCGVNMPSLDKIHPNDKRLEAFVWSWDYGQPADSGNCALLNENGRFEAAACGQTLPHACVSDSDPEDWQLSAADVWGGGAAACPVGYHFSVPGNGRHNEFLKAVAAGQSIWLNYSKVDGEWQTGSYHKVLISLSDAAVDEGNAGENPVLSFPVTLTGHPGDGSVISVELSTDGGWSATEGDDYEFKSQELTFTDNGTQNFEVLVNGDDVLERYDYLTVNVDGYSEGVEFDRKFAVGTIQNDDEQAGGDPAYTCGADNSFDVNLDSAIPESDGNAANVHLHVFEPDGVDCNGSYPIVLFGNGWGGGAVTSSNSTISTLLANGFGVASIAPRGFGSAGGMVRVMDPDFEGQDYLRAIDWMENKLSWAKRNENGHILLGGNGVSYGGGFQLLILAVDSKNRMVAPVPGEAWTDLDYSLNPGNVVKTFVASLLSATGLGAFDPYVNDIIATAVAENRMHEDARRFFRYHGLNYFCQAQPGARGGNDIESRFDPVLGAIADAPLVATTNTGYSIGVPPRQLPPTNALFIQGFRDQLFNFNEAATNYQCLNDLGGDVRLMAGQVSSHMAFGGDVAGLVVNGLDYTTFPIGVDCGNISATNATMNWYRTHLLGDTSGTEIVGYDGTDLEVCMATSAEGMFDFVGGNENGLFTDHVPVGGVTALAYLPGDDASPVNMPAIVPMGLAGANPTVIPLDVLGRIERGSVLTQTSIAGISTAKLTVTLPGGLTNTNFGPAGEESFDSIIFVGIGHHRPENPGVWDLMEDQVQPVRGLGTHEFNLVGVAERLQAGDQIALLVYGYHPQYLISQSRDPSVPLVMVSGTVNLPLHE